MVLNLFDSPSPNRRQIMAVAAPWGIKVDEPNVGALEDAAPEVPGVQGHDLLVIIVDTEIVIVIIPGLVILLPVPLGVTIIVAIEVILFS